MAPVYWIVIVAVVVYFLLDFFEFEKNPEEYSKRKEKRKFLRSPINPVASNEELFDAFGYKPELKEESKDNE